MNEYRLTVTFSGKVPCLFIVTGWNLTCDIIAQLCARPDIDRVEFQ